MNRLQSESSPYLQQHAENPVDWYPWGEEALARARMENKPVLISIGYSTCHWCHVMERESFEDPDIAAFMNEHFINIKVDREERPDLDHFYMEACQVLAGTGGWPLHVFLTPDGRPFFAGTYFPPEPGARRLSWFQALQYVAYNFYQNRQAVERQADKTIQALERTEKGLLTPELEGPSVEDPFPVALAGHFFQKLSEKFDTEEGGFERAPKFPNTMALEFLLHYAWFSGEEPARQHVFFSIDRMLQGGIYDQLGGGIARYSTDRHWLAPHFEKMLYDNALLVRLLADAYRWKPGESYRFAIRQTLEFIDREMTAPEGGFYAALDADSEGKEGKFYTWEKEEIDNLLGEDAEWACSFFGVNEKGNWEGRNILHLKQSPEAFARERGWEETSFRERLRDVRSTLFLAREQRLRPHRDEKILLGWNALQCSAYIAAGLALGEVQYHKKALRNLHFLLDSFIRPGTTELFRVYMDGNTGHPAFLNDYAFLIDALLGAYQLTFELHYLRLALQYTEHVLENFYDPSSRLFFFTSRHHSDLPLRRKELHDAEMPSGNSAMVGNLQQLAVLFDRRDFHDIATEMLRVMKGAVGKETFPFSRWATAFLPEIFHPAEIAVTGPQAIEKTRILQKAFIPGSCLMASEYPNDDYPLLAYRWQEDQTLIYVCRNFSCQKPVEQTTDALALIQDTTSES